MATDAKLFISGFTVEYLNGDDSYLVIVFYRNADGVAQGLPDKFSLATGAKLKKFIAKFLLANTVDEEEVAEEAQA